MHNVKIASCLHQNIDILPRFAAFHALFPLFHCTSVSLLVSLPKKRSFCPPDLTCTFLALHPASCCVYRLPLCRSKKKKIYQIWKYIVSRSQHDTTTHWWMILKYSPPNDSNILHHIANSETKRALVRKLGWHRLAGSFLWYTFVAVISIILNLIPRGLIMHLGSRHPPNFWVFSETRSISWSSFLIRKYIRKQHFFEFLNAGCFGPGTLHTVAFSKNGVGIAGGNSDSCALRMRCSGPSGPLGAISAIPRFREADPWNLLRFWSALCTSWWSRRFWPISASWMNGNGWFLLEFLGLVSK